MNETKHTPGPWTQRQAHEEEAIAIYAVEFGEPATTSPVAQVYTQANARLIVDAPELLEALTKLSNEVLGTMPLMEPLARQEFGNTNYNILIQRAEEARAAVAKATTGI